MDSSHAGSPAVTFRRGSRSDASALAAFAARGFTAAFAHGTTPDDLAEYLATTYGEALQAREIEDPAITTIIGWSGHLLAAYAQVRAGQTPDCVREHRAHELQRFYVDPALHGRGIAQGLMAEVYAAASARSAAHLWLSVWEENGRARAFYRKVGFEDVGVATFMVGSDAQTDCIMLARVPHDASQLSPVKR